MWSCTASHDRQSSCVVSFSSPSNTDGTYPFSSQCLMVSPSITLQRSDSCYFQHQGAPTKQTVHAPVVPTVGFTPSRSPRSSPSQCKTSYMTVMRKMDYYEQYIHYNVHSTALHPKKQQRHKIKTNYNKVTSTQH